MEARHPSLPELAGDPGRASELLLYNHPSTLLPERIYPVQQRRVTPHQDQPTLAVNTSDLVFSLLLR